MTHHELINGDRVLAKYVGKEQTVDAETNYLIGNELFPINKLRFYVSWNWLMRVIELIETEGYWVKIKYRICEIGKQNEKKFWVSEEGDSKREAVWRAAVTFVKNKMEVEDAGI